MTVTLVLRMQVYIAQSEVRKWGESMRRRITQSARQYVWENSMELSITLSFSAEDGMDALTSMEVLRRELRTDLPKTEYVVLLDDTLLEEYLKKFSIPHPKKPRKK